VSTIALAPVVGQITGPAASPTAESWVFWILAPLALGAALAMVLLRNPVHSALMLVLNFFAIAAFYAVLEAQFLAVTQIIVYAGAIMVLFLFVIMLLGVGVPERRPVSRIRGQGPAAVLLGLALVVVLIGGVAGPYLGGRSVCGADAEVLAAAERGRECAGLAAANADGNVRGVGGLLFTDYVWPFEVTSVLLVIAAVGAMTLGRKHDDPGDLVDRLPDEVVLVTERELDAEPGVSPDAHPHEGPGR
jgi:NADH-quinone oxidoreductase subunit J